MFSKEQIDCVINVTNYLQLINLSVEVVEVLSTNSRILIRGKKIFLDSFYSNE